MRQAFVRAVPVVALVLGAVLVSARPAAAQAPGRVPNIASTPNWPAADPADVASEDAILRALYDVISGPKGAPRNWTRFRSLFVPGARLMPTIVRDSGRRSDLLVWTPDEYVTVAGEALTGMGFFERELHRTTERYGNIVQVFSTYDSKRTLEDPQPFARGINSIQLLKDGGRYWIVSIFWDSERPGNAIPPQYLPK